MFVVFDGLRRITAWNFVFTLRTYWVFMVWCLSVGQFYVICTQNSVQDFVSTRRCLVAFAYIALVLVMRDYRLSLRLT